MENFNQYSRARVLFVEDDRFLVKTSPKAVCAAILYARILRQVIIRRAVADWRLGPLNLYDFSLPAY